MAEGHRETYTAGMDVQVVIVRRSPVTTVFKLIGILMIATVVSGGIEYGVAVYNGGTTGGNWRLDLGLLTAFSAFAIIASLVMMLRWAFEGYYVEEGEVIHRRGILFRHQQRISLRNVEEIRVEEGLFGRMLKYGTIVMHNPLMKEEISLGNVSDPYIQVQVLENAIGKDQGGSHIVPLP